jgi:hypothetical protein
MENTTSILAAEKAIISFGLLQIFILHFYDLFLLGNPDRLSPGFSRDTNQQLIGPS